MKILVSLSARTQKWFDSLTKTEQREYLQKHPNSKFGKKAKPAKSKLVKANPIKSVKPAKAKPVRASAKPTAKRVADPVLDEYDYNVEWAQKELAKAKSKGFPSAISAAKALLANALRKRAAYLRRKANRS